LHLVAAKARVYRDGDRAQTAAGEEGREPGGEIRQPQCHAIPRADANRAQPGSEPGRFVGERRVGYRAVAIEERRRPRRVHVEERTEGGHPVHTLLLRDAKSTTAALVSRSASKTVSLQVNRTNAAGAADTARGGPSRLRTSIPGVA